MTEMEVIELINSSLAAEFELSSEILTSDAKLKDDLGLDSLDMVDLVIVLERAFNFKIREEKSLRAIRTLGDIHQYVLEKVAEYK